MRKLLLKLGAAALVATSAAASNVQAADLHVMSSGGFTAAYKVLAPKFASQTDNTLETALGPSMGKSPEAIPNRLGRGEPADAVIMVGYALDELITVITSRAPSSAARRSSSVRSRPPGRTFHSSAHALVRLPSRTPFSGVRTNVPRPIVDTTNWLANEGFVT